MFPNGFQESFVNCDSAFQPRVVTPPTTTPPRTTTPTTSPTTAPTTQTTSRPPTPNERTTSEQMPAETTAETHTTTRMIGMIVVKDSSALIPGIAAGAAALCVAFIALLACGLRQRNRNSSNGKSWLRSDSCHSHIVKNMTSNDCARRRCNSLLMRGKFSHGLT